ncbi:phosphotransferase [Paenibacillus sp. HWE-109]|uniref:phosphotransferase n=1 Tax=Paenibacillus sp. HWE-109 TaxID=1306526 RepID=UPI001EDEC105|nr:phosphotransferase [Paenibacillus sp. HWE-109]UKS26756.1 phosphotransferase [Paenibacillus sp. HWE-109]
MKAKIELIFTDQGNIRNGIPHEREEIYVGRNGQKVERIRVHLENHTDSFIYKRLTNFPSLGKEMWVQDHIIPLIPSVRVPRIFLEARTNEPENYWMIIEDMGPLQHGFETEVLKRTASLIPAWHLLSKELLVGEFTGHTPEAAAVQAYLRTKDQQVRSILAAPEFKPTVVDFFYREVVHHHWREETVVSHGDLNPLNIAMANAGLVIIDWEYLHVNSVYWDLFCLLDITSPFYRRPMSNLRDRLSILMTYTAVRGKLQTDVNESFIYDYHRYCALYSVWVLILIEFDLEQDKFERSLLLNQRAETFEILISVVDYLMKNADLR